MVQSPRLKTMGDGRLAYPTNLKAMERATIANNGTKHDAIVARFDQSGMAMQAAAKALGSSLSTISYWRVGME